jgi:ATP-dependent Clp protease ATP-binding subunit ClpA
MNEQFTETAKEVVAAANNEARLIRHDCVGTEHLLLGLLQVTSIASRALRKNDLSLQRTRDKMIELYGQRGGALIGAPPLSSFTGRALERASVEAQKLNHDYVAPEHILLALLQTEPNEYHSSKILRELGVNLVKLRRCVVQFIRSESWHTFSDGEAHASICKALAMAKKRGNKRLVWEEFAKLGYVGPIPEAKFLYVNGEILSAQVEFTLPLGGRYFCRA